jgi:hypothetical protein
MMNVKNLILIITLPKNPTKSYVLSFKSEKEKTAFYDIGLKKDSVLSLTEVCEGEEKRKKKKEKRKKKKEKKKKKKKKEKTENNNNEYIIFY